MTAENRIGMNDEPAQMAEVEANVYVAARSPFISLERKRIPVEHVVTVAAQNVPATTKHHPLVDGLNYQSNFDAAVDTAREFLDDGVVVHCRAGVSRSPAVLATALAAERGETFDEALERVEDAREEASPLPPLRWHGRHYLGEESIRTRVRESEYDVDPAVVAEGSEEGTPLDVTEDDEVPWKDRCSTSSSRSSAT